MALFESETALKREFPTTASFTVPVEVREMPGYGVGHRGVVALTVIPAGTKFWVWTDRVKQIHHTKLEEHLRKETTNICNDNDKLEMIQLILRQGFVLPNRNDSENNKDGESNEDYFCSNPTDAGRFMNHSNNPNCGPDGTLRDIEPGEELTMDYSFHGNPSWYQDICNKYGVLTERAVAVRASLIRK